MNTKSNKPAVSQKGIDRNVSVFIFLATLVSATMLRIYQLCTNMDFETGEYINKSFTKNYPVMVIAAGAVLILLVLKFGCSDDKAVKSCILLNPYKLKVDRLNKKMSLVSGVSLIIMAMLIAFETFIGIGRIIHINSIASTKENHVGIFTGIGVLDMIIYVFLIVAVATFLSAGYNVLKGDGITKGNSFFFAVYGILKLLEIFRMVSEVELIGLFSEKTYMMLTSMCAAIFFAYTARFFFDCEKKNTKLWMCFYGYLTGILASVSVIPRYVMYFLINYAQRDGMTSPDLSDFGLIFLPAAIIALFWSAYVYRVMPRLNLSGKRRWVTPPSSSREMTSL